MVGASISARKGRLQREIERAVLSQRYPQRPAVAIARGTRCQCQAGAPSREAGCGAAQEGKPEVIEEGADGTRDVIHRPHRPIQSSLREAHAQPGHGKNKALVRDLRHARTIEQAIKAAHEFRWPECEGVKRPRAARH